jgi:hypothetical protein
MVEDLTSGRIKKSAVAASVFETDNDIYQRFGLVNFRKGFTAARKKMNRPAQTKSASKYLSFFNSFSSLTAYLNYSVFLTVLFFFERDKSFQQKNTCRNFGNGG